jgi:hypothetical protein
MGFENWFPLFMCPTGAGEPKLKYSLIPFNSNGRQVKSFAAGKPDDGERQ